MATLFERLGGEDAVSKAVELFYRRMLEDDRVSGYFDDIDMDDQVAKQKAFLTMAFGGPNHYSGNDLRKAHERMDGLDDSHVDIVIEHLGGVLQELGADPKDIEEVASIANSVRNDVLNR